MKGGSFRDTNLRTVNGAVISGSRRRLKRRRSERLSSINCMKNNTVVDMQASAILKPNEGPDGWSNGSLDLSAFFMLGDSGHNSNSPANNNDGSLSTAPTADYTTTQQDSSIHLDDVTLGSTGRRNELAAVFLEFDPGASRDLGIGTALPKQQLHSLSLSSPQPPKQEVEGHNRSTMAASTLTQREVEQWPFRKSRNPHNDYLAKKYNRDRVERMLNLFCPPDSEDEDTNDGKDNTWNGVDTEIPVKQSSFKTMNSKVLEDFSLEAYSGGAGAGASRTKSSHAIEPHEKEATVLDMSSLKVLQHQSSRALLRSRVRMPELPTQIEIVTKSPQEQEPSEKANNGIIPQKPPSRKRTPRRSKRPRYDAIQQESRSNLTSASPTGMDDFERWDHHQNDNVKLHPVVSPLEDAVMDCSQMKQIMEAKLPQKALIAKSDTLNRGRIDEGGGKEAFPFPNHASQKPNLMEIKARMRRIAAEYGSSSTVIETRKCYDEGQSIQTETSSILDLKTRLRLMESNFRHFQETLCS